MPHQQTIHLGQFFGQHNIVVRTGQLGPREATQLRQTLQHLSDQGIRQVWLDCQHVESLTYAGQHAILAILQQAQAAQLGLLWYGFSPRVKQQLAASGLYLLLQNTALSSYRHLAEPAAGPKAGGV